MTHDLPAPIPISHRGHLTHTAIVYRFPDGQARLRLLGWKAQCRDDAPGPFASVHAFATELAEFIGFRLTVIDLP